MACRRAIGRRAPHGKIARALASTHSNSAWKERHPFGEYHPFSTAWNEGREPALNCPPPLACQQCVQQAKPPLAGMKKAGNAPGARLPALPSSQGYWCCHGHARHRYPYLDMGGASIKMNDDGSFILLVGATDLGTGSDTVIAQMVAEGLVCLWMISLPSRQTQTIPPSIKRLCLLNHVYLRHSGCQSRPDCCREDQAARR